VDEQAAMMLGYPGGQFALLSTAIRTNTPHTAVINGTDGRITIHAPWWTATRATVQRAGKGEKSSRCRLKAAASTTRPPTSPTVCGKG
jgi:hypothetical protein